MYKSMLIAFMASGLLLQAGCASEQEAGTEVPHNTLTSQEVNEGWELLFDGETTDGWRAYNGDQFPESGWGVEDGQLVVMQSDGSESGFGGDIITEKKYENFEFQIEWQISEGGNSGMFYHVLEQPGQALHWSAPEIQLIDDENYDIGDNRLSGSLYDLLAPDPLNANPAGEWNELRIVVENPMVEHWQNGVKVLEYERWTAEWFEMLRNSKFETHPEFGALREGHIGLQDHGDLTRFRNIKIKELD
ncbi:MAG: DUF1080 domain-containing protein [Balneolales bacterium]